MATGPGVALPSLLCRAGTETVALPAADIMEILRLPTCTRVPNAPASLVGLANLRGAVLPVVSLARLLHGHAPMPGPAARVVVTAGTDPIGLLVDAVADLSRDVAAPLTNLHALLARDFPSRGRSGVKPAAPVPATPRASIRPDLALVTLRLAGQDYAFPLTEMAAVIRVPALATVPGMGATMLGVAAIRGTSLPVMSLRALLGLPEAAAGPAARILVLQGMPAGVLVDSVGSTLSVPADAIDPVPPVLLRGTVRLRGLCRVEGGRRLVCLLSAADLFDATTAHANGPAHPALPPEPAADIVVFRLGAERYGLPVAAVDRVLRRPVLTPVPGAPEFVAGLMNLRGRAVPVIDLARRFAAPGPVPHPDQGQRVMVVTTGGVQAGFAVDAVTDVLAIPRSALRPASPSGDAPLFDRITFGPGGAILLVSAASLLREAERDVLAAWSAAA